MAGKTISTEGSAATRDGSLPIAGGVPAASAVRSRADDSSRGMQTVRPGGHGRSAAAPASGLAPPPAGARIRWAVLALIAVGVLISFVDRTSLSAALAVPSFKAHFGLTDVDRGWVASAFFWSYTLLQMPLGWVVDRYGVKWPYAACFLVWCLATAATGLMTALAGLVAMRLVVGAAEAVVVPASWSWLRSNFREDQAGTAVGLYMLGTKAGPALGAPIGAWLIVAFDWRAMFFVTGLAGLLWLVPWVLLVRDDVPKRTAPAAGAPRRPAIPLRRLLLNPLIWGTMIVNFCYNYFVFYCMTWMPAYLVEQRGLSLGSMGLYDAFSFAGIAVVALLAGVAADGLIAHGRDPVFVRKAFTIAGFALASTVVLGAYSGSVGEALFWNVASLSGLGLATANNLALCRLTLIPAPVVGIVTGLQQVATGVAGIVAPLLSGWLLHASGGYTLPLQVIFAVLVTGALATALLLRPGWAPKLDAAGA